MHPPVQDKTEFDDFVGPMTKTHYVIAEALQPGLWTESADEHVRWCFWAKQGFHRRNTYFGVQFWYKRVDALLQADRVINAIKENECEC